MTLRSRGALALLAVAALAAAAPATAQNTDKFTARLAWVPITGGDRANVTGKGSASAMLAGTRLTVDGTYEGLAGAATVARLHQGVARAARGPAIGDLAVTKGTSGKISGSVTLNAEQLEALKQGRLYIQVHSEKGVAPDGSTLWGWLLR